MLSARIHPSSFILHPSPLCDGDAREPHALELGTTFGMIAVTNPRAAAYIVGLIKLKAAYQRGRETVEHPIRMGGRLTEAPSEVQGPS
ncbi:MAG: hypothetical protein ACXW4P_19715 [Thermoanaerobaculia bacterium]